MVASVGTIKQVAAVVEKYVAEPHRKAMMEELLEIPGNSSFKATVKGLAKELLPEKKKRRG